MSSLEAGLLLLLLSSSFAFTPGRDDDECSLESFCGGDGESNDGSPDFSEHFGQRNHPASFDVIQTMMNQGSR